MTNNPVKMAYEAHAYIPVATYRKGGRRKTHNPAVAAPALVQAMEHLGPGAMPLADARIRARRVIQEPEAARFIAALDWNELKQFLSDVALFIKASGQLKRGQKGMRRFEDQREVVALNAEERAQMAMRIAGKLGTARGDKANRNKLKRLSGHIGAASDKWDALTSLARFYPLKGVPEEAINEMVGLLEQVDLYTFKEIVAQSLVFFEASEKGWEGLS